MPLTVEDRLEIFERCRLSRDFLRASRDHSNFCPATILVPRTINVLPPAVHCRCFMNIDLTLDYQTILRNEPRPVHIVANLCALKLDAHSRPRSAAFAVVLDRSGSMAGEPLRLAREACAAVVRICARTICLASLSSMIPRRSLSRCRNRWIPME